MEATYVRFQLPPLARPDAMVLHRGSSSRAGWQASAEEAARQLRQVLLALVGLGRQDPPTLLLAGHAFLASAGADPALRELCRAGNTAAERAVVGLLEAAGAAEFEARILLALAAGLADATYRGQFDARTAAETVEMHSARVIPADGDLRHCVGAPPVGVRSPS
jgi:hypothetical protein